MLALLVQGLLFSFFDSVKTEGDLTSDFQFFEMDLN